MSMEKLTFSMWSLSSNDIEHSEDGFKIQALDHTVTFVGNIFSQKNTTRPVQS
jgi:hypothetical protein